MEPYERSFNQEPGSVAEVVKKEDGEIVLRPSSVHQLESLGISLEPMTGKANTYNIDDLIEKVVALGPEKLREMGRFAATERIASMASVFIRNIEAINEQASNDKKRAAHAFIKWVRENVQS